MPILRSSTKDLRRTARRTARNKAAVGALRTAVKKVRLQIAQRDSAGAQAALAAALPVLDRAADKGFIHKNAAARTKSRLTLGIRRLAAPPKA
ncbi:MAG TPA: 30S ribosomal protein S20 [Candidatus Methylomirabilis sp.]|jgi:small subunit ribosomal protein S20